jgi:hypothetical protein
MSAPAFTPGPWAAADEPDPIGKRYVVHSILTATGVAHCWTTGDARLIAAAPDLFAALAGLANALECPSAMKGRTLVDVPQALEEARAALAKAARR